MNFCKQCGKEIDDKHKFCNSSCAAKYNNMHRDRKSWTWTEEQKAAVRKPRERKHCKYCNAELHSERGNLCSSCRKYRKFGLYKKLGIATGSLEQRYRRALEILKKLYFENRLSSLEIFKQTGVNFRTMRDLFKENGISTRNLSESSRLALELGKVNIISCTKYLHGYHTTWDGRKVFYRSSYELEFAKILDSKKIFYQVESLRIRYFDSQKNMERIAVPDFYIPETNEIVEIKSSYTLDVLEMKDKFKAYREAGYIAKLILNGKEEEI